VLCVIDATTRPSPAWDLTYQAATDEWSTTPTKSEKLAPPGVIRGATTMADEAYKEITTLTVF